MFSAFFKCKHPAGWLLVAKPATVERLDDDFEQVTSHLECTKCGEPVTIRYAAFVGGVDAFLMRDPRKQV